LNCAFVIVRSVLNRASSCQGGSVRPLGTSC